ERSAVLVHADDHFSYLRNHPDSDHYHHADRFSGHWRSHPCDHPQGWQHQPLQHVIASSRRGVTLIELLIAMVVAAIVGAATISLMLTQTRFAERAEAQRAGL